MIIPGWQKAYEEWDRRWLKTEAKERENRIMSVIDGNVLAVNDKPVISAEGEWVEISAPPPPVHLISARKNGDGKKPFANWKQPLANSS